MFICYWGFVYWIRGRLRALGYMSVEMGWGEKSLEGVVWDTQRWELTQESGFKVKWRTTSLRRGAAPKWSWVRFLLSDPRVVQVLDSIVLITSRACGRRISGTQHENPECVMLAVAVLRAQNLRSCPAVGNQMLSKGVCYAGSELLTLSRSQASSFHQQGRVILSGFLCRL